MWSGGPNTLVDDTVEDTCTIYEGQTNSSAANMYEHTTENPILLKGLLEQ